jgi:nucleolar complex protein 3
VRKRPKTKPTGKGGKGGAKGPKILSEYELQEGYDPEVSDQDLDFVESLGKSAHGSSFLQALGSTDFRPGVDRKEEEDDIIERYESKPRKIKEDQTKEAKEEEKKKHRVPLLPVKNEAGALEKAIEVVEAKKRAPSAAPKEQADSKDSKNATTKAAATAGKQQQKKERVPEDFPSIKRRIAVCSVSTIENPEGKGEECLDVLLQYARSQDPKVCQIAMLSLQAIFKDILPTYKIKSIDETDLNLTKEVRRQHKFEGMLLRTYQQFLRILFKKSRSGFDQVKVSSCKCLSSLLKANYNFNYRSDILKQMVPMMNSRVKEVSTLALDCISSLFMIDKEGEATLESLQLVADFVRKNDCMLNGKIIESLKGIRLRHDLSRKLLQAEEDDSVHIGRKEKQRRALEKRRKRDAALADGKDVDYHLGSATQGVKEKIKYQTKIVEAMFECIFRVLKNFKDGISEMEDGADTDKYFHWPLLSAALSCLAKYCAHINIDFMKDLFNWLCYIHGALCPQDSEIPMFELGVPDFRRSRESTEYRYSSL